MPVIHIIKYNNVTTELAEQSVDETPLRGETKHDAFVRECKRIINEEPTKQKQFTKPAR